MNAPAGFGERLEGLVKVSGALDEGDVLPPGTLHPALVEAQIARGRVVGIDDAAARAMPGFARLITAADAESLRPSANTALIRSDQVHFAGEGVAMLLAESALDAAEAARRIVVRY